jgi:hypothetical protein
MSSGRVFQNRAANTGNARSPTVDRCVRGMSNRSVDDVFALHRSSPTETGVVTQPGLRPTRRYSQWRGHGGRVGGGGFEPLTCLQGNPGIRTKPQRKFFGEGVRYPSILLQPT